MNGGVAAYPAMARKVGAKSTLRTTRALTRDDDADADARRAASAGAAGVGTFANMYKGKSSFDIKPQEVPKVETLSFGGSTYP